MWKGAGRQSNLEDLVRALEEWDFKEEVGSIQELL